MNNSWKAAEAVFDIRPRLNELKGRKVRNRRPMLLVPLHEPAEGEPSALSIVAGRVGFISGLDDGDILLALPRNPNSAPADLTALQRIGSYQVLRIKWTTFESQFDVAG